MLDKLNLDNIITTLSEMKDERNKNLQSLGAVNQISIAKEKPEVKLAATDSSFADNAKKIYSGVGHDVYQIV